MRWFPIPGLILLIGIPFSFLSFEEPTSHANRWFKHHTVSLDLPAGAHVRYGTPAVADFDRDGDLDFAVSVAGGPLYWFELKESFIWQQHEIGSVPTVQLGGGAFDVDRDGWTDIVTGGHWFRNSIKQAEEAFTRYRYDPAIDREIHDLVFADMNGDGSKDLVVLGDLEGCFWYDIPFDPVTDTVWEKHLITMDVVNHRADIHGGFFPGGIGDLDMDGDADVVLPGRWYRNEARGKTWTSHLLPFGSVGYWGLSARSWIVDMDGDGDPDIVMTDCDQVGSRGAWLENDGQSDPAFTVHILPVKAPGIRGSFHSLWVDDFDRDGDLDIFTMEQEDASILPRGTTMRAFIWENMDGKGVEFAERIVLDMNIGGHDVIFGDADGDGDMDAYVKVWSAYRQNSCGGKPHVDFLENLAIDCMKCDQSGSVMPLKLSVRNGEAGRSAELTRLHSGLDDHP